MREMSISELKMHKEVLEAGISACIERFYDQVGVIPQVEINVNHVDLWGCDTTKITIDIKSTITL